MGASVFPAAEIQALQHDQFVAFRQKAVVADNLVISANGLDHSSLTSLVETYFNDVPTGKVGANASSYLGGDVRLKTNGPNFHLALAFPGAAFGKPGFDTHDVLATLLRAKLQRESASATALNFGYKDAGLLVAYASTNNAANTTKVATALLNAYKSLTSVSEEEVTRAKRAVALQRALANEQTVCTRALERAAIAGVEPTAFAECREVNKEAVAKAAQTLLQAKPSIVAVGPAMRPIKL